MFFFMRVDEAETPVLLRDRCLHENTHFCQTKGTDNRIQNGKKKQKKETPKEQKTKRKSKHEDEETKKKKREDENEEDENEERTALL